MTIDGTAITSSNASSQIAVGANVSNLQCGLVSGGVYTFVSRHNGLAMDSGNSTGSGSSLIQWPMNLPETSTQQWKLTSVSGNTYTLVNQQNGYALSTANSTTSGARLIQSPGTQTDKDWAISSVGSGYYKVISAQSGDAPDDDNVPAGTRAPAAKWCSSPQRQRHSAMDADKAVVFASVFSKDVASAQLGRRPQSLTKLSQNETVNERADI